MVSFHLPPVCIYNRRNFLSPAGRRNNLHIPTYLYYSKTGKTDILHVAVAASQAAAECMHVSVVKLSALPPLPPPSFLLCFLGHISCCKTGRGKGGGGGRRRRGVVLSLPPPGAG